MIVDKINKFLTQTDRKVSDAILEEVGKLSTRAFKRQFLEEKQTKTYRLSSIGHCLRQQAYKALGFEEAGKEIDARSRMVFLMGDLTEVAVVGLAKAAGCQIAGTGDAQLEVDIDGVVGHPDGVINGSVLLEVKSMSSYSFDEFERGKIQDGYRYQCNAYMSALGFEQCCIVALNKDAGVLSEMVISKDLAIVAKIKQRITALKKATKEDLPAREYQPDEKGFLPWPCAYCAFHRTCWPTINRVLKGKSYRYYVPSEVKVSIDD